MIQKKKRRDLETFFYFIEESVMHRSHRSCIKSISLIIFIEKNMYQSFNKKAYS